MELGKKIASLRKMKKVTQTQLAEYLAVNPQTVSRWEAEGGTPDVMLLPKIANFFQVSLDELFGMTDMEQINDLVYKYSVLRDEKSFEEVMRSIEIALHSLEEELENTKEDEEGVKQCIQQLKAWKVHIYIQKSRAALETAEAELDELRKDIEPDNPLYLPMKLQKQQFRIQMGEANSVINQAKSEWETDKNEDALCCYMEALYDAQRSADILQLWRQAEVQAFICKVNEENEGLWQMMFDSAYMESDLDFFEKYSAVFKQHASEYGVFEMEWTRAKLYDALGKMEEKITLKGQLLKKLESLNYNEYIKDRYYKKLEIL